MKSRNLVEQKYWEMCEQVTAQEGLALYDVEFIPAASTLRIFVYDKETKTAVIEDCVKIDRAMTPHLEAEWVPESLVLEVSSPGMFRPLKAPEHFTLAKGEQVAVVLQGDVAGVKGTKGRGKLLNFNDKNIRLDIDGQEIEIPFAKIKKVNLDPDY